MTSLNKNNIFLLALDTFAHETGKYLKTDLFPPNKDSLCALPLFPPSALRQSLGPLPIKRQSQNTWRLDRAIPPDPASVPLSNGSLFSQ